MKRFLLLLTYSILGCGCFFSPQKDNSHFYALGLKQLGSSENFCNKHLGIICVELEEIPAYTDVSQFITLKDGCELVRFENFRWGEPFKTSVTRSLYVSLAKQLNGSYTVLMSQGAIPSHECVYKVSVRITNFIFNGDKNEIYLTGSITIFKEGKLYAICDYNDCFNTGSADIKAVINAMDWALNSMSLFISQCLDMSFANTDSATNKQPQENGKDYHSVQSVNKQVPIKNKERSTEDNVVSNNMQYNNLEIIAHGEVYIIVDSVDGDTRYFSGRLSDGESASIICDGPVKIISTDDSLIETYYGMH